MSYTIHTYRIGELSLHGKFAFHEYDPDGVYPYAMSIWVIKGGDHPIIVDTGPRSIEEINKGLTSLVKDPVTQRNGEDMESILKRAEVDPLDVQYVFFTHLHYDHTSNIHLFPNAKIVVNKRGWEEALRRPNPWVAGEVFFPMRDEWKDRLVLVEDEEVLPGISTFWLGGHTPCSQAVSVKTAKGTAVITGDVVSLYENIERDIPIGVYENLEELKAGMQKIRDRADIIIPSHDPEVLKRWPEGIIG